MKEWTQHFGERVLFNEPLAKYLAYQVGGPADILVFPKNLQDLEKITELSKKEKRPITVVGTGTNLLVLDGGIRGITVALHKSFQEIEKIHSDSKETWVKCGGGVQKPNFLNWAIQQGLGGLEFSAGVPGTIGGGIFMNAGTKYGCYGDILKEVQLYDFASGPALIRREEAHFGYREQSAVGKKLVVSATFALKPADPKAMQLEVDRIIQERAEKQPLEHPSCGSTFKNPPTGMSAGRLIEHSGLKGTSVGGAEISLKHANFILNKGSATAQDIYSLIQIVKDRVFQQFKIQLECEVIILGEPKRNEFTTV